MNKLVKRLLTGTLAFATILTALPVTAVHASGELAKHEEQDKAGMGYTLYIGSLKSEVYFCVYEKSYE